ncbi:MAG TPA: type IV pili twitching motility protein PilT, partial [Acidobacteriota bacterium]|nr:type IV pili twitching motility protein PilT [Acidobacteriota bacterium]
MAVTIQELLKLAVEKEATDLHITTHVPPRLRIDGQLISLDYPPFTPSETKRILYSLLNDRQKKMFEEKLELDFSFGLKELGRFRGNIFMQKGSVAGAFRRFLPSMWSFSELG